MEEGVEETPGLDGHDVEALREAAAALRSLELALAPEADSAAAAPTALSPDARPLRKPLPEAPPSSDEENET